MQSVVRAIPLPVRQRFYAVVPRSLWRATRTVLLGQSAPQIALRRARVEMFQLRSALRTAPGTVGVQVNGHTYLACRTLDFRSSDTIAANLRLVADALEAHDVPYFVLDAQAERRRVVVVADEDLRAALRRSPGSDQRGRSMSRGRRRRHRLPAARRRSKSASAKVVRVFQVLVNETGGFLAGPVLGCDLEFWPVAASTGQRPTTASRSLPARGSPRGPTGGPTS